jgi:hypothetical protein
MDDFQCKQLHAASVFLWRPSKSRFMAAAKSGPNQYVSILHKKRFRKSTPSFLVATVLAEARPSAHIPGW